MTTRNIMIDLETMSVSSNAAVIAIGAVEFDPLIGVDDEFYITIDLQSCIDKGLKIDGSTVIWWMKQSDDARKEFFKKAPQLKEALFKFHDWLHKSDTKDLQLWGNGSDFDNVILANAFKRFGINDPWPYYSNRCFRTIKASFPNITLENIGIAHNALDDAKWQAEYLMQIVEQNNLKDIL